MSAPSLSAGAFRVYQQATDVLRRVFLQQRANPGPEHILLAMLNTNHDGILSLLAAFSIQSRQFERALFEQTMKTEPALLEASCGAFLRELQQCASTRQSKFVDETDLMIAAFRSGSRAIEAVLAVNSVSVDRMVDHLQRSQIQSALAKPQPAPAPRLSGSKAVPYGQGLQMAVLAQFGRNLTDAATKGELPPVRFRDEEIEETLETICRIRQRNPLVVGEPGAGKSYIIFGVAQVIRAKGYSGRLAQHEIYTININSLAAGALDRKELLQRVEALIGECRGQPTVIAMTDFVHVFGDFKPGKVEPAAALLREAVLKGDIQCFGECTPEQFRQHIEEDSEFMEACCVVRVEELNKEQTFELLGDSVPRIESFHRVEISREALVTTLELGERFLPERKLPGKATSLLDAAAARVSLRSGSRRVGPEDVAEVVARLTGLDAAQILTLRVEDVGTVASFLKSRIVGQDEAVRRVVERIQLSRSGLTLKPNRPDAVVFLAGPTGVGKTELAKSLSEALQASPNKLIRFDMSEFGEKHTVARLIGAPPGYIGYDEEAQLIKRVRANPRGVLLFDEIEKAHPEVHNIFLQMFDDGRLTDSHGQTADFSQTIILLTSNLGMRDVEPAVLEKLPLDQRNRYLCEVCERAVKKFFSPEFLNRLDDLIIMNFLTPEVVTRIAENQLTRVLEQLAKRGKGAEVTNSAFDLVVRAGYSSEYGARFLNRTIEDLVLKPLAKFMLENPGCVRIRIGAREGTIAIEAQHE